MSKKNKQKNIKTSYSCFEEKYHGWTNPVKMVGRWRRNIKHAYQRIRYGYCDRDVWSIDWWFLNVVPNMLQDLRETAHGFPSEIGDMVGYDDQNIDQTKEQEAVDKWDSILAEIIFYLREANEETCQKKNPFEEQYHADWREFDAKYAGGEKLKTAEEKAEEKKKGLYRMYMPSDLPEYRETADKFIEEERRLNAYRDECKNKGLELFSKWFWNLWD